MLIPSIEHIVCYICELDISPAWDKRLQSTKGWRCLLTLHTCTILGWIWQILVTWTGALAISRCTVPQLEYLSSVWKLRQRDRDLPARRGPDLESGDKLDYLSSISALSPYLDLGEGSQFSSDRWSSGIWLGKLANWEYWWFGNECF